MDEAAAPARRRLAAFPALLAVPAPWAPKRPTWAIPIRMGEASRRNLCAALSNVVIFRCDNRCVALAFR